MTANFLHAQEFISSEQNDSAKKILPDVVVEANNEDTSFDQVEQEYSPHQVFIISQDQFPIDAKNAQDILVKDVSVQIRQTGSVGSLPIIFIRGADAKQINLYINSIAIPNINASLDALANIPVSQIERIEIYKSGAPAKLGRVGIGGAINIVTKQTFDKQKSLTSLIAKTQFASFGYFALDLQNYIQLQSLSAKLNYRFEQAENDFTFIDYETPNVQDDDVKRTRINDQYKMNFVSGIIRDEQDDFYWQGKIEYLDKSKNLPTAHNQEVEDTFYQQQQFTSQGQIFKEGQIGSGLWSFLYQQKQGLLSDPFSVIGLSKNLSKDETNSLQFEQLLNSWINCCGLTSKTKISFDQFEYADQFAQDKLLSFSQKEIEQTFALETTWLDQYWTLSYQPTFRNGSLASAEKTNEATLINDDQNFEHAWQLGTKRKIDFINSNNVIYLSTNLNKQYRLPTIYERFGNDGRMLGNEDLLAEQSYSADASINWQNTIFDATSQLYYRHTLNNILVTFDSQGIGRFINEKSIDYWGVENNLRLNLFSKSLAKKQQSLTWWLKHHYQRSHVDSNFKVFDENFASGFYHLVMHNQLDHQFKINQLKFKQQLNHQFKHYLFYDRANSEMAPLFQQIDWQITLVTKAHQISFAWLNLTDQQNYEVTRKPIPGQRFQINYQFTQ